MLIRRSNPPVSYFTPAPKQSEAVTPKGEDRYVSQEEKERLRLDCINYIHKRGLTKAWFGGMASGNPRLIYRLEEKSRLTKVVHDRIRDYMKRFPTTS